MLFRLYHVLNQAILSKFWLYDTQAKVINFSLLMKLFPDVQYTAIYRWCFFMPSIWHLVEAKNDLKLVSTNT